MPDLGNWIEPSGYLQVGLLMLLETVFPPIPSEIIMPLAGLRAARGELSLPLVIASGTAGAMLGNALWYAAARLVGAERFGRLVARHGRWLTLHMADVRRAERWFEARGAAFVCLGRLVPTMRSLVSLPAGLFGMRAVPFLVWSTIGTAGWTSLLAVAGWALGRRYTAVNAIAGPASTGVLLLLGALYAYRLVTWRSD